MSSEPAPFLSCPPGGAAPTRCVWLKASDGTRLRAACWQLPDACGHVLLFTGRTEYIEKAAVPAAEWLARGYAVVSLDWRGQGLSDRAVEPRLKGHVGDFSEFQMDVDAVLASGLLDDLPGRRVLMAHSMGGCIGVRTLSRAGNPAGIDVAILSAPMLGIALDGMARVVSGILVALSNVFGLGTRWPPLGDVRTPYVWSEFDGNVLTSDRAMWDWMGDALRQHAELALGMPTLGWLSAATRETRALGALGPLTMPTMCLLGEAEEVVSKSAIRAAVPSLGFALHEIADCRHEVLIEAPAIRAEGWSHVDRFLAETPS